MRNLVLLFAAALALGCSDDDNTAVDPMLGTWKFTYMIAGENLIQATPCQLNERLTLNADHTFVLINTIDPANPDDICHIQEPITGNFEVQNNMLILNDGFVPVELDIYIANQNQLQISSYSRSHTNKDNYIKE